MSAKKSRKAKDRPFPWPCSNCFTATVVPTVLDYTAKVKQDGVIHELHLPALEIPRCQTCGETVVTSAVDERINDALRSRLHLLTPAQIRQGIEKLDLKQQELAERLGVAPETISRWVNGFLIQTRAMDNLLRLFFALPEVRSVLRGASQDPQLGTEVRPQAADSSAFSEPCQA
jgi:putative zinc finger/helix-turn-helix YgiT family protein